MEKTPVPQEELPLFLRQAIADQNSAPQRDEGSYMAACDKFWDSLENSNEH